MVLFLSGALFLFGVEMLALAWLRHLDPGTPKGYVDKPVIALGIVCLTLATLGPFLATL